MNIQQFDYVLALAEYRHFEKAASSCFISQSTLSTMIFKFEDEIGVQIFDRKTRPVGITKEGVLIISQLKQVTYEISKLEELSREIKGETIGEINLGCIHTVAPFLLPLVLSDFAKTYPEINIQIKEASTDTIMRQLQTRDIDIGIVSPPLADVDLIEYPLYKEAFVYFDMSNEDTSQISIEELKPDNFWLMEESHCMREQVLDICDFETRNALAIHNIVFKAGSIDSLIRFTKASAGTTLLPLLSLSDFYPKDLKHIRFFNEPVPTRTIALVTHRHFVKQRVLRLLQDAIMSKVIPAMDNINMSAHFPKG